MMKWLLLVAAVAYASADSSEDGVSPGYRRTTCPCGWANKDGGSRIVGGLYTKVNEYPFIVGIAVAGYGGFSAFCGGAIITPNHVLTAAHCTDDKIKAGIPIIVLLGVHDRTRPGPGSATVNVASIQQHPGYRKEITINDISVLTLASSIYYNRIIGPVCMPLPGLDVTGQIVRVIGYGADKYNGTMTLQPKKLDSRVITPAECASVWGDKVSVYRPTQICTLAYRQATCQGDSGGPLVWLDPQTNRYTLVGLVSYGGFCDDQTPTVLTRVEAFLPWIMQQIAATKPVNVCVRA